MQVNQKAWYASKTIWVSLITIGVGFVLQITGKTISGADQLTTLGFIFMILRLVTNGQISLSADNSTTPTP